MKPTEAALAMLELLESASINYLLVGAFAYGAYGIPRSTEDADFVLALSAAELDPLLKRLPAGFSIDPQARMELFTGTFRWILRVEGTPFQIELFLLGSDPHHLLMFQRKRRQMVPLLKREAWIPTAEDLVIQKLRWARLQDLDDVRNILSVQAAALDFAHIDGWNAKHGTTERFANLRAEYPPLLD